MYIFIHTYISATQKQLLLLHAKRCNEDVKHMVILNSLFVISYTEMPYIYIYIYIYAFVFL